MYTLSISTTGPATATKDWCIQSKDKDCGDAKAAAKNLGLGASHPRHEDGTTTVQGIAVPTPGPAIM